MDIQQTIAKTINLEGVGLHSGKKVRMSLKPAAPDHGIVFIRTDLAGKPAVKACVEHMVPKSGSLRYSCLEKEDIKIFTTEHLLAALNGMGIDNIIVELDAEEAPGFDGSSMAFVEALEKAGIVQQEKARKVLYIREAVSVEDDGSAIVALPAPELKISYTLDYNHAYINSDFLQMTVTPDGFKAQLASARTFCLEEEVEQLRKQGLGKGCTYDNALVVGKQGVIKNKLRFDNEFIRHKILDLLGDLYILGVPVKGHFIALRSGHSLNLKMVKKLCQAIPKPVAAEECAAIPEAGGFDINQIMKIIPHREPFLFVDRILNLEKGKRIVGIKNVTINDYFFRGHFPGRPVMPGVLILEAMAQVGGVMMLSSAENRGKIAFFMSINNAKFRKPVVPGDQLVFDVVAGKLKSKTGIIHGEASVDGKVVAEADMMFVIAEE